MKLSRDIWILLTIVFVIVLGTFLTVWKQPMVTKSTSAPVVMITYSNFEDVMSRTSLVSDLPEDSTLLIRFFNFKSGEREWERSYVVKKGVVKEGMEDADITMTLSSKYLDGLNTANFCSVIKIAKKNGDLGVYTKLSAPAMMWKFKGMLKYRECLGF